MQKHEMLEKIIKYHLREITTAEVSSHLTKYTESITKNNSRDSMLERAMLTLDDCLNANSKKERKEALEYAKLLYKEYNGVDYVNRNQR